MIGPLTNESPGESTLDTSAIENLMQVMVKGLRAIQLYLPNNPIYQQAVQNIRNAFGPSPYNVACLLPSLPGFE